MNIYYRNILLIILFSLINQTMWAQLPASLTLPDHPRIIWQKQGVAHLKQHLEQEPQLAALHDRIIAISDAMIALPPVEHKVEGRRLLGVSRTCLKRVLYLAYSYRMTGDEAYLKKAEKEMLAAAAFPDWNPSHFLDVAEMTAALAFGYDWLYHDLSETTRQTVANAIYTKGILPSTGEHTAWLKVYHNWNQVCNGGISLGAWAVFEKHPDTARFIIERAFESIKLPMSMYEPDGTYPEGPSYWNYGTVYNLLFIDSWDHIMSAPFAFNEAFKTTPQYYLHVFGPQGSFNYSDGKQFKGLSTAIFWFAGKLQYPTLVYNQQEGLEKAIKGEGLEADDHDQRFLPLLLIWASRIENLEFQKPEKTSWTGHGETPVSMHRSAWRDDAIFIGIKGGAPEANHGHMDIGSFVLDANKVRWAIDLGNHSYHDLEKQGLQIWGHEQDAQRWDIFRYTNYTHNTLVVDGRHQRVDGHCKIIKTATDQDFKRTVVDLSPAYVDQLVSALRGIAIVENKYVLIQDEVQNNQEKSTLRWAMMTHDDIELIDKHTAIIRKDGKSLMAKIISPRKARWETFSAQPPNDYEDANQGVKLLGFSTKLKANQQADLKVLLLPNADAWSGNYVKRTLKDW